MPTRETNSNGEATFDLAEGNYRATAQLDGYQSSSRSFSVGADESITETITLQEADPASLTVVVTDASTGNPIEDATVAVGGTSGTTNSLGEASFNLAAGEYEAIAIHGAYIQDAVPVSLDWGESATVTVSLEPDAEPTLIDNFERDSISPWQNTHEEESDCIIRQSSGLNSTNGLYVPAPGSAAVYAGLENFPEAGGGPDGTGAWEFWHRIESTGGSADITRVDFAAQQGGTQLRWQVQPDYCRLAGPNNSLDFYVNVGEDNIRIFRVNEWDSSGYIDCSIHESDGSELDRQSTTFGSAPTSGGMRVWSNYTTAFSVDSVRYLD